jgi:hypothetical protein
MTDNIIITDPKVLAFYAANKNIDIVTINHVFIDIMNKLSTNLSNITEETINSRILQIVTNIDSNMNSFKLEFLLGLQDHKAAYIEELKTVLNTNTLSNNEKLNLIMEKNNETLLSKTTNLINDIIPKNQDRCISFIENSIKTCCSAINSDTQKLLSITNDVNPENNTKLIIENVENQLNRMISNVQQPILQLIKSNDERQTTNINQIRDNVLIQNNTQQHMSNELNNFFGRYKNKSQFKGSVAETELYFMLQHIVPAAEIINVTGSVANCDYCVKRKGDNNPDILFESKDYTNSVPTDEIEKFKRDIQLQKTHGVLISQNSPITFKTPFQIDIINGLIHVYVPNTEYNSEKIKTAIDIIDSLHIKLQELEQGDDKISKSQIDDILDEYKTFAIKKTRALDTFKTMSKQLQEQLEDIQLPNIRLFLVQKGKIENDANLECQFCNSYIGKNKASLSAHKKGCKFNPNLKTNENNIALSNSDQEADAQPKPEICQQIAVPALIKDLPVKVVRAKKTNNI